MAVPPLLVRGTLNLTNFTYSYTNLTTNSSLTFTLASRTNSGFEVEVVLGLNRTAINAAPGALLAGILRFTDSLGVSQVDVPVSAIKDSSAGLWVGGAAVTNVNQYLKSYPLLTNSTTFTNLLISLNLPLVPPPAELWTPRDTNRYWSSLASSANGTRLVAAERYEREF